MSLLSEQTGFATYCNLLITKSCFILSATFMDALVGQWWAHSLGLGYLLPADHIKSNLKYAAERNYVKSFDPGELGLTFLSRNDHIMNSLVARC